MQRHGKKMFPGTNASDIFFLDNPKKSKVKKIDLNKYINKTNNEKNNMDNKTIKRIPINKEIIGIKIPVKKRVLKKFNSTTLKKGEINPFLNKNDTVKKRQLKTHRSVDNLKIKNNFKNISLTEPDFNENNVNDNLKSVDLNKIKVKHRILGSNKLNSSFNSKESHKVEPNKFSALTQRNYKEANRNRNIQTNNFYNKFINKNELLNKKANNNQNKRLKKKENLKLKTAKEEIFLIKKEKMDDNVIDINSLKKNLIGSGINFVSLTGVSSSLDPINRDSVRLIINSNDFDKSKLNRIEKVLKNKGLKLNEIKNNYNKKYSRGIFPAKSKWNDGKYGGREAKEKLQLSMEFQKKEKQNKFHKKNLISKNNFYDITYKNNNIKRNKSME